MFSKSSIFCLALILALVDFGSCVKCYHCTSQGDAKCADAFTSSVQAVECNTETSLNFNRNNLYSTLPAEVFGSTPDSIYNCHKIILGTGTVIRTCLPGKKTEDTCKTLIEESKSEDKSKLVKSCASCDKDACNAAGSLSLSLPLTVVAFVVSYAMYKQ